MNSIDQNGIFDHMYCTELGNLLKIQNIMSKYQYVFKVAPNFKVTL